MPEMFADVHVAYPIPIDITYTYRIPEGMRLSAGMRVTVPFAGRNITAYTVSVHDKEPEAFKVKDILSLIDESPIFDERLLEICRFTADSYCSYAGEALAMALPSGKKPSSRYKAPVFDKKNRQPVNLTEEQNRVVDKIMHDKTEGRLSHCIFGVTGSGKTEVYIDVARRVLAENKSVIYLVPEISLSSQIYERLLSVFGDELMIYHSHLTPNQRLYNWQRFYKGEARIAIGTRSAVFLQAPELGLIIIDEEHDSSFKEHSSPRYNARRIAAFRSKNEGSLLIMGSATPALETLYASERGQLELHRLSSRYGGAKLPAIDIVPLDKNTPADMLSPRLRLYTKKAVDAGNQVIYLLNRRGFAPMVICDECGEVIQCPHCNISLNLHKNGDMLCHYCGYTQQIPPACPRCGSEALTKLGAGTQRIEEQITNSFNGLNVRRLDQDSVRKKGSVFEIIDEMRRGEINILIGTQMVAKGFDFPRVSVVGVLMADIGLNLPDFRASERIFSLLLQVAGRSGRGSEAGMVFLQTRDPEHPVFRFIKNHDYERFYQSELEERRMLRYPPFSRLARLLVRGHSEKLVQDGINALQVELDKVIKEADKNVLLLGPVAAPIERIGDNYRYHIILKGANINRMRHIIRTARANTAMHQSLYLEIDIDPVDML